MTQHGMEASSSTGPAGVEWRVSDAPVPYVEAVDAMERRVADIRAGRAPDQVWLLEHPALYTAGTSAKDDDLLDANRFPVHRTGRGGQFTYHGPGQRVAYVMLDLKRRGSDVRAFVHGLEEWVIRTMATFNVVGERRDDRIGIWVAGDGGREDKIAAIGVRVRRWVSYHGVSINVEPNLEHFSGIVPCGIAPRGVVPGGINNEKFGVTSLVDLGLPVTMNDLDVALAETFGGVFDAL